MEHQAVVNARKEEQKLSVLELELEGVKAKIELIEGLIQSRASLPIEASQVRAILRARSKRSGFFPDNLFADPAWDMLLDLYASDIDQVRVSVSSLCVASGVPQTTALRWINVLEREGLVSRLNDPFDARRTWIQLSPAGKQAMNGYFGATASPKYL